MNEDVDSNQREIEIPNHIIISLARLLMPEIQAFYNSDEGKVFVEALKTASKT